MKKIAMRGVCLLACACFVLALPQAAAKAQQSGGGDILFIFEKNTTAENPDGHLTRATLIDVLYRLGGNAETGASAYSDVPSGAWYERAAAWAAASGVYGGEDGLFVPEGSVNREQLAVILWNYAKAAGCDVSIGDDMNILSYDDALSIADGDCPAIQWACAAGLFTDDGSGRLGIDVIVTRAEAAGYLRTLNANLPG